MARHRITIGNHGMTLLESMAREGATAEAIREALARVGCVVSRATVTRRLLEVRGPVHRRLAEGPPCPRRRDLAAAEVGDTRAKFCSRCETPISGAGTTGMCSRCTNRARFAERPPRRCAKCSQPTKNHATAFCSDACRPQRLVTGRHRKAERRGAKLVGNKWDHVQRLQREQGGRCAACGSDGGSRGLVLDHCHATGAARGLLCGGCNSALGMANDSSARLEALLAYARRWEAALAL